jgi:hypothetical protein
MEVGNIFNSTCKGMFISISETELLVRRVPRREGHHDKLVCRIVEEEDAPCGMVINKHKAKYAAALGTLTL